MENPIALIILIIGMGTFFFIGWYSRRWTKNTAEFYVAGGQIPWKLNGVAMFSNYASAASFLGVAGAIAIGGIDNWWLALGFFAAWVVVVLILASPLRRSGKYTVADALQERFSGPEIRLLTIIAGIIIGVLYLVPQLVGAGHLFNLLIPGLDYIVWVAIAGGLTAAIVLLGGMRGTSYNQAFHHHHLRCHGHPAGIGGGHVLQLEPAEHADRGRQRDHPGPGGRGGHAGRAAGHV